MIGRLRGTVSASALALLLGACGDPSASASTPEAQDTVLRLDADGLPIVRAGLWEITRSEDGVPARTFRQCLTRAFQGAADDVLSLQVTEGCRKDRSAEEGQVRVVSSCDLGRDGKLVSDFTYRGSPIAYALTAEVTASRADGKTAVSKGEGRGRWLGDCPGDMVPGDILEFDG